MPQNQKSELKGLVLGFSHWADAWRPLNNAAPPQMNHLAPVDFTICMCSALGIKSLIVAVTVDSIPNYQEVLGVGKKLGLKISYLLMHPDEHTAQAVLSSEEFLSNSPVLVASAGLCCYGPDLRKFVAVQREVVSFSFGCESQKNSLPTCEMFYLGKSSFAAAREAIEQQGSAANGSDLVRCHESDTTTKDIASCPGVYCTDFNEQKSSCCDLQELSGDRLEMLAELVKFSNKV